MVMVSGDDCFIDARLKDSDLVVTSSEVEIGIDLVNQHCSLGSISTLKKCKMGLSQTSI